MITTYTVAIQPNRIVVTDKAISLFLLNNPVADVDDALEEIFQMGVNAMNARCEPEVLTVPNEVCL